ncbi:MAG: Ig-like domain-containing protein [Planctomycetota bacterium]
MKALSSRSARVRRAPVLPAIALACLAPALTAGCSSSDGDDDATPVGEVVQHLTIDPNGRTLVATIDGLTRPFPTTSVEASGGQMATSVTVQGDRTIIEFDARVTPTHQIRLLAVPGIGEQWRTVTTTDPRVPQLGILSATQDTSDAVLGGDTITVAFVAGPRVVEAEAEDPTNWTLAVDGVELDLTGSSIVLSPATQVVQFTLGPWANLHANFALTPRLSTVADTPLSTTPLLGTATGDADPPGLDGGAPLAQNLDPLALGDEFGRIVEIDFDEPISPVFGATPSNFSVVDHPNAQGVTVATRVAVDTADNTLLRVAFSRPVVPGLDQVTIDGVLDAHGNAFGIQTIAITQASTVANGFDDVALTTLEGIGNDQLTVTTLQALDPDTAAMPSRWTLSLGGIGAVDLSTQALAYDLLTRTLTIDLDFDVPNGTTADVTSVGGVDIDGEDFSLVAPQAAAAGDASPPTVESIVQNRTADPTGRTVDVTFSEDLDVTSATTTSYYDFTPTITVPSATLLAGRIVRLQLAGEAIPGDVQLTVEQAVSDPAGNDLGGDFGPASIASTDVVPPSALVVAGRAVEGYGNDIVTVLFDDTLIEAEIEDASNWTVESPVGTAVDVSGVTISYDSASSVATMTLDGVSAPSLLRDEDLRVSFSSMRDLGGNTVTPTPIVTTIAGEANRPTVESAHIVAGGFGTEAVVRFSEAMADPHLLFHATDNPTGPRYAATPGAGPATVLPASAVELDDGLGVRLTYNVALDPAGDIDVIGLTDLAGNLLFPAMDVPLDAEDATAPSQSGAPTLTAVPGIRNDRIEVRFGVPMASWQITSPDHYLVTPGLGSPLDLSNAVLEFDGTDTVSILLASATGGDLVSGTSYTLDVVVDPTDPLRSRQGVVLGASDTQTSVPVVGDVTDGPVQGGSTALLDPSNPNAVLVVFNESVDPSSALQASAYDYDGGTIAQSVSMVGPRAVRATFAVPVSAGDVIAVSTAAAVDTAGNAASGTLSLAIVDDQTGPAVLSVAARAVEGFGGDYVEIVFNEELVASTATDLGNYTIADSSGPKRIVGISYLSTDTRAKVFVEDLDFGDTLSLVVDGVTDLAGNLPSAPLASAVPIGGDPIAPTLGGGYVNVQEDSTGVVIDVEISEEVDTAFAAVAANWTASGAQTVEAVEVLAADHVRLRLSAGLGAAETLTLAAGLTDPAGNIAGALVLDPVE